MDHFNLNFSLGMSESAKLFIVAFSRFVGISLAEFGFVPTWVIHLLNFIVREVAFIILAVTVGTKFMTVIIRVRPSSIKFVIVIDASFSFVMVFIKKRVPLRGHCLVL